MVRCFGGPGLDRGPDRSKCVWFASLFNTKTNEHFVLYLHPFGLVDFVMYFLLSRTVKEYGNAISASNVITINKKKYHRQLRSLRVIISFIKKKSHTVSQIN